MLDGGSISSALAIEQDQEQHFRDPYKRHDNRGTAGTLLAEVGATAPEIAEAMTWTVDKAQKIIDTYLARPGVLAANAIQSLRTTGTSTARPPPLGAE